MSSETDCNRFIENHPEKFIESVNEYVEHKDRICQRSQRESRYEFDLKIDAQKLFDIYQHQRGSAMMGGLACQIKFAF